MSSAWGGTIIKLVEQGHKVHIAYMTSGNIAVFDYDAWRFTDAGFPSTFRATAAEVEGILVTLTGHLAKAGMDAIVLEIADGLYQAETATLLSSPVFAKTVNDVIFAAGDAMGAAAGVEWLRHKGLPVRAVSGVLTASPLAITEAAKATGLPVFDKIMLRDAAIATELGIYSRIARSA